MKTPVSPHMVAVLLFGTIAPLSAQNIPGASRSTDSSGKADSLAGKTERHFSSNQSVDEKFVVPAMEKAQSELPTGVPVFVAQDSLTLNSRLLDTRAVDSVVDLDILRTPSLYRKMAVSTQGQPYEVASDSLQNGLARISAVYREVGKKADEADCGSLSLSVEQRVKLDVSKVLEVVAAEIGANPDCACEVVKAAIKASDADIPMVVSIVESAINVAPESMRIVSQCAIAAVPESLNEVQALLAKLDPNSGTDAYSSKSAKSAKSAKEAVASAKPTPNPLDLPPIYPPIIPIIFPPPVTNVNP